MKSGGAPERGPAGVVLDFHESAVIKRRGDASS